MSAEWEHMLLVFLGLMGVVLMVALFFHLSDLSDRLHDAEDGIKALRAENERIKAVGFPTSAIMPSVTVTDGVVCTKPLIHGDL